MGGLLEIRQTVFFWIRGPPQPGAARPSFFDALLLAFLSNRAFFGLLWLFSGEIAAKPPTAAAILACFPARNRGQSAHSSGILAKIIPPSKGLASCQRG